MKSFFIGNTGSIANVYPDYVTAALKNEAGLESSEVLTAADLEKNKDNLADTEYLFSTWGMPSLTEQQIQAYFPNLKAVFYAAGSVQGFARPFLASSVHVFSAWAANAVPVAEYTFSQVILANKSFFSSSRHFSAGNHAESRVVFKQYPCNFGCKVGIIGAGMIGVMVIKKLIEHNLKVLVFDPFMSADRAQELGVELVSLEKLFSECQTISNHLANNEQTVGMLNKNHFSLMKDNATFINTGRGAQVVEEDLIDALRTRPNATALLDVTLPEPPVQGSPLYEMPNVILTPHIAGSSGDEVHRMAEYMLEEFRAFDAGKPVKYDVSEAMLKTMA